MVPLENILYCLFTEVLPLCRCWTFLKAYESPGLRTLGSGLWTCAPGAGGSLPEVFCMGSAFICTGSACFAVAIVVTGTEGVVVLKGVADFRTVRIVLELYWHCTTLCLFYMSPSIWNVFDVPFDVPPNVPSPVLLPLILLK